VLGDTAVSYDGTENGLLKLSHGRRGLEDGLVLVVRAIGKLFHQVLLGRSNLVLVAADSRCRFAIVLAALGSRSAALSNFKAGIT